MKTMLKLMAFSGVAAVALAQQIRIDLDNLASKASETVNLSLNGDTLRFAAQFLNGKDENEAQVRKLLEGIEGIYVRSYEFKGDGEWKPADLDRIRFQLRTPQWSRIVEVKSKDDGEDTEIYLRTESQKTGGLVVLSAEAKELTVVNIVGKIDLKSLSELGGHFGIPKVETPPQKGK